MLLLSLPELLTLTLYIVTVSMLLIALSSQHERAQRLAAAISLLVGTLASISLYGCYSGKSDEWFGLPPPTTTAQSSSPKRGAVLGGGGGSGGGGVIVTGAARQGGPASGDDDAASGGGSGQVVEDAAAAVPGVLRASFALPRSGAPQETVFRDCPECPEMVLLPTGYAPLGSDASDPAASTSERPRRAVRIAKPIAIGRYEITTGEYARFVEATGRGTATCGAPQVSAEMRQPATCITWSEARAYAVWLSERTGRSYRLPSSGEWEYAARGRTGTPWYTGQAPGPGDANVGAADGQLQPVGRFPANAFRVHDMIGNVAEWVLDCWVPDLRSAPTDGGAAYRGADCRQRTIRDAAWSEPAALARSAARRPLAPEAALATVGFRVVREMKRD